MVDPLQGELDAGTPPAPGEDNLAAADDVMFEDDQITDADGQKLVPLDVALAERKKRQTAEQERDALKTATPEPVIEPEPDPEPAQPAIDWEKLMGEPERKESANTGQAATGGWTQERYDDFNTNLRTQLEDNPWQALMYAVSQGIAGYEAQKNQAKQFVPDIDQLPLQNVSDTEVQILMQNPHALKALIAKAKSGGLEGGTPTPPAAPVVPAQPLTEKDQWIAEGRKQERELIVGMGTQSGQTGDAGGTGEPEPAPAGENWELDSSATEYFKARGYTEEEIAKMAPKIIANRRRKGLM